MLNLKRIPRNANMGFYKGDRNLTTHAKLHKKFKRGSLKRISANQYAELSEYTIEIARV